MSWLGLLVVIVGVYLAFKLAGAALQTVLWLVILVAGYVFVAPMLDWPPLDALVREVLQ